MNIMQVPNFGKFGEGISVVVTLPLNLSEQ
jgi:hypothetical protein